MLALGGIHLNAVGADGGGLLYSGASVGSEGLENHTDGKIVHKLSPFQIKLSCRS
jgi:hypothetical protein